MGALSRRRTPATHRIMSRKMINFSKLALMAATVSVMGLSAFAADAGQHVIVAKNHTLRVALSAPAGSVIVGNPDIADVSVVDSRTVYIVGKGFGSSGVSITGRDGRTLFDGQVTVTSAQVGAITVYKGLKPSTMVCSNICISDDTGVNQSAPANAVSFAPAPDAGGAAPTAMVAQ